jgi:hypothetical protein
MKKIFATGALLAALGIVLLVPGCLKVSDLGTVAPPYAEPGGIAFKGEKSITLKSGTDGATIYYTLDNTAPIAGSSLYCASGAAIPLTLSSDTGSTTVRAIAAKQGWSNSTEMRETYKLTVEIPVATPDTTPSDYPGDGTAVSVTLSCATVSAIIYYTLDGTDPSAANGTRYNGTDIAILPLADGRVLRAIAMKEGLADSEELKATYRL